MHLRTLAFALITSGLLIAAMGCTTTRQDRSARAASSMADLHKLLAQGEKQVDEVQKALNYLHRAEGRSLRKAYSRFDSEVRDLRKIAAKVDSTASMMAKHSDAYFKKWQAELGEIHNRDLSELAQARQSQLKQQYLAIQHSMTRLKNAYATYDRDMSDMQRFLGNDLTKAGSHMAAPYLGKLEAEAEMVKQATAETRSTVGRLTSILSP
jgi:predicted  nucleic acid-binding Zn-ribbon protein